VPRGSSQILDEMLVLAAQAGSTRAFAQLYERAAPGLARHAARLLHDEDRGRDIAQDCWIDIARGLRRLEDPTRFRPWAYAIATRKCVDEIRRLVRSRRVAADLTRAAAETSAPTANGVSTLERGLDLAAAIQRLPFDQRLAVSLHYGEGLGIEEIAAAHALAAGTVKSRLFAARNTLRSFLEGPDHDPD
jgi:RNA polymerase sigma-70 factor, ECF subfamily